MLSILVDITGSVRSFRGPLATLQVHVPYNLQTFERSLRMAHVTLRHMISLSVAKGGTHTPTKILSGPCIPN